MRTKTLLSTAALLAAGLATSMAQSSNVYSLNVVGYVNAPVITGYNFAANPFDTSDGLNKASTVYPNPSPDNGATQVGPRDGDELHFFDRILLRYKVYVFDALTDDTTTGFSDRN